MTRFCSIFNQLLQVFPRTRFQQLVRETRAERHARGFTCWGQFVAMLFCQLGNAQSLREICGGLASCEGKLTHLGVPDAPKRSTLAYANAHRSWELFQKVFYDLLAQCRAVAPGKRFRFKNKLLSLDATVVTLCAEMFPWSRYRQTKGAVKLHFTLDHDGCLPTVMVLTDAKHHDITVARTYRFTPGTVLVFDRGFIDFAWLADLTCSGVIWVTRAKEDLDYESAASRPLPSRGGIVRDDLIVLRGPRTSHRYPAELPLRRVQMHVPDTDTHLVFLTNHLDFGATTIARIYKDRWQIELFFKALKQNLRVKTFVGTSVNALQVQIWTALIAILLLKYLMFKARFGWSLSNLVALLRMNLFVYRDLWAWLNAPFTAPPVPLEPVQQPLAFM